MKDCMITIRHNNNTANAQTMRHFSPKPLSLVVAWFLIKQDTIADASSNLRQQGTNHQKELQDDEGPRLFVRYRGPRGHRIARKCAKKVTRDFDDDNIIIIEGNDFCLDQLRRDTQVIEADFDYRIHALGDSLAGPNGDSYSSIRSRKMGESLTWELDMIQAGDLRPGNNPVTICVVDSGVAIGHPVFNSSKITGNHTARWYGPDWKWDKDVLGHGTHVASTILSALRGYGDDDDVDSPFRLHIVRSLNDQGQGYESEVRLAVEKCVEAGAQIVNLSVGGEFMSLLSKRAYTSIVEEQGILLISAAGNRGVDSDSYPASHPSVVSVGAVYEWGRRHKASSTNDQVELAAPGYQVLSATSSNSAVHTEDISYAAFHIKGTSDDIVISGKLVYCEGKKCDAKGDICIMTKDETSLVDLLESCEDGGGSAAIIFDAAVSIRGNIDNWSVPNEDIHIPAVSVAGNVGTELLIQSLGATVTIGDVGSDNIEYSYTPMSGTSVATPFVSAAAALLWSHFGDCTNHQIRYAMDKTAKNPDGKCNENYGYGIVKVQDAYDWLLQNDCNEWDVPQDSQGGCTTV